ncbi:uncharacterized protein BXZ73DRAFT_77663 [Epithele typhae]|uniref:uncharacterized protein n=1 Tax=Epithele typhae TaxID=378194 RepID=UPI00200747DD|nr:uncharacterized protein BXZ73DRAFT_77663 [Epithele typhae]KAH9931638.1 hypothetical protein BXZ73DRAFT_77663 [Epithele typhae]
MAHRNNKKKINRLQSNPRPTAPPPQIIAPATGAPDGHDPPDETARHPPETKTPAPSPSPVPIVSPAPIVVPPPRAAIETEWPDENPYEYRMSSPLSSVQSGVASITRDGFFDISSTAEAHTSVGRTNRVPSIYGSVYDYIGDILQDPERKRILIAALKAGHEYTGRQTLRPSKQNHLRLILASGVFRKERYLLLDVVASPRTLATKKDRLWPDPDDMDELTLMLGQRRAEAAPSFVIANKRLPPVPIWGRDSMTYMRMHSEDNYDILSICFHREVESFLQTLADVHTFAEKPDHPEDDDLPGLRRGEPESIVEFRASSPINSARTPNNAYPHIEEHSLTREEPQAFYTPAAVPEKWPTPARNIVGRALTRAQAALSSQGALRQHEASEAKPKMLPIRHENHADTAPFGNEGREEYPPAIRDAPPHLADTASAALLGHKMESSRGDEQRRGGSPRIEPPTHTAGLQQIFEPTGHSRAPGPRIAQSLTYDEGSWMSTPSSLHLTTASAESIHDAHPETRAGHPSPGDTRNRKLLGRIGPELQLRTRSNHDS